MATALALFAVLSEMILPGDLTELHGCMKTFRIKLKAYDNGSSAFRQIFLTGHFFNIDPYYRCYRDFPFRKVIVTAFRLIFLH